MILKRMPRWLQILLMLLFQIAVTLALVFLTEIYVQNSDIQLVAELGLVAFSAFATWQTLSIRSDFRRYITCDLLSELASTQGRTIRRVVISKDFEEIHPGDEYTIEFLIEGQLLIQELVSKMVTPFLQMRPPLFQGNADNSGEHSSIWRGQPVPCDLKDGTWELKGQIDFNTYKINPGAVVVDSVTLHLGFQGENGLLVLELGRTPVHLISPHEVFQDLIRLGTVKKVPPGYHVLAVSRGHAFHTNLVFLSKRFQELKTDEEYRDRVHRLEAAMAHRISEAFTAIANRYPSKKLEIVKYEPEEGYESELNCPSLMDSMLAVITSPQRSESPDKVLVAIYQTKEFAMRLENKGGFGICLFGFSPIAPSNVHVIFDLWRLELNHDKTGSFCQIDQAGLEILSESSKELFERYAPELSKALTSEVRVQIPQGQSTDVSPVPKEPEPQSETLESLLELIRRPAQDSVRYGRFVDSEPAITKHWVNLGIFADELHKTGVQDVLQKAVISVLDQAIQSYTINAETLFVLNLCTRDSGIADELPILWDFQHPSLPTGTIGFDRHGKIVKDLPDQITDIGVPKEVIILSPFDSYVSTLEAVLQAVRDRNNIIICIVSLFSIAKTWDYLSPSDYFDIIPLFRIHPDYPTGLTPLTRMADYRRAKPWLFHDK